MTNRHIGRAKAVAQVSTITIGGTIAATDTFSVTIGTKAVTFTATTTTIAHVVAGLVAALNASTAPTEHGELTWADSSPTLTGTGDVKGVPHTITVSKTGAANTISISTTTAATGPNHWDNANNWTTGAVPLDGENWDLANSNASIYYGWPSSTLTFPEVNVMDTFTGTFGLPEVNGLGYPEYRELWPSTVNITLARIEGQNAGTIQFPSISTEVYSGNVIIRKNQGSSDLTIDVRGGSTVVAIPTGAVAITAARVAPNATLINQGANATLVTNAGNYASGNETITTLTTRGGTASVGKNPVTLNCYGGTAKLNGSNTVTTIVVGADFADGNAAIVDLTEDLSTFTVTNITLNGKGLIDDPHRRVSGATLTKNCARITT